MNYQVLSIAGYDRSGTTFLGKLLNKYEDAFFIGELDRGKQNYNNGFLDNCGCGCEIPRCPVWSRMTKDPGFYREKDFSTYSRISEQLGVHLLIDSSKRISQMEGISSLLRDHQLVIHIIRDPKGVIYSRKKTRKRRVRENKHPKPYIARHTNIMLIYDSLEWCFRNVKIEAFKKNKKNVLTLIYEDLESSYFEELLPFLERQGKLDLHNYQEKPEDHILFGNVNRRKPVDLPIRIDKSWEEGLNFFQKTLVDLITFPVRHFYRYKF